MCDEEKGLNDHIHGQSRAIYTPLLATDYYRRNSLTKKRVNEVFYFINTYVWHIIQPK